MQKCPNRKRMGDQSPRRSTGSATVMSAVLRALSICAPAALLDIPPTLAQALEPTALAADIPAQPLPQALEALGRQTGLQFVYVSGVVQDQRSHAVSAGLGANKALTRMLEGTGLKFEYLTPHNIRILAAVVVPLQEPTKKAPSDEELQEVIVTANRREQNLQNVPMTIQVLTGETLAKLNATTFDDFVKYLPAVSAHGVAGVPGPLDLVGHCRRTDLGRAIICPISRHPAAASESYGNARWYRPTPRWPRCQR